MNKNTGNVAKSSRLHRLPPQRGLLTGGAPAIPPAPHFAKGRNISFCAPGSLERFGPVFLEEVAQSHQPIDFGPGPQLAAENRGLQGFLGRAGVQTPQASAPVALVCLLGRAQDTQVAFTTAACVGPMLPRSASRTAHFTARFDQHRAMPPENGSLAQEIYNS